MSEFIAEKILEINLKYQQKLKIYTKCSLTLFINIISIVHARETKTWTLAHQTIYSGRSGLRPEFRLEPVRNSGFQFCGSLLTFLNIFLVWLYKGLTLLVAHIMGFGCNTEPFILQT